MKAKSLQDAADSDQRSRLVVVLHGANLNLLGERPVEHYGSLTLAELNALITEEAKRLGWHCLCFQTNHEGVYIDWIHEFRRAGAMIVNPGAWTHYSYAIHDALELVACPVAEVHLSHIETREEWRRRSVITPVVDIVISGKGPTGYVEALRRVIAMAEGNAASA